MPWYITLGLELLKLLVPVLFHVKNSPDKKVAAKKFSEDVNEMIRTEQHERMGSVGEPTDLKRI